MVTMTAIILLLLLAAKCCKLSESNTSEMEYVDYIEDWNTTTVHGEKLKCVCNDTMQCLYRYLPATALVSYAMILIVLIHQFMMNNGSLCTHLTDFCRICIKCMIH